MEMKKLLWIALATLAALLLMAWTVDSFGFHSPVSALLLNWLAMSWSAMLGPSIRFSLASGFYDIQPFEQKGRIYEALGIKLYKKIVRRGPLSIFSPTLRFPQVKTVASLRLLEREMCQAETGHLLIFFLMLLLTGYALWEGRPDTAAWVVLFNLLINGYPIILQRYNRAKLEELIGHQPA